MDGRAERRNDSRERQPVAGFEPPRVERVLTSDELEREVLYAGVDATADVITDN